MKKLYRHHEQGRGKLISGIFSGLGGWMEVSPNILRAGYILLAIVAGFIPAILIYLMFHFVIPKR
jgi:phage shock protein PspC (stress-responsive transcriptional regulator)